MIRENQRLLNQFNVLTDAVAVFLAMLVSYWLRFELFHGVKGMPFNYYVWLGVVAAALTLLVFAVAGLYEPFLPCGSMWRRAGWRCWSCWWR